MGLARAMQRRRRMKFEELFERRQALRVAPVAGLTRPFHSAPSKSR